MWPRPSRLRSTLFVFALAGVLAVSVCVPLTAGPAAAATQYGNDVSWPQCSTAQGGYGLPMPPDTAQFVVIGLTKGLPFTANPCLADQVAWAAQRSIPAQAYTMAAFPTAAQLSTYGTQGPWSAATRLGQLANVGYAEAVYTLALLGPAKFTPKMVWVDVEARPAQPWPTGTRLREAENRAVISGLVRRLGEAGYAYGFYSNASGWQTITGSWWVPGAPAWVTVGKRTSADAAAACAATSFSTGRPHLAQWTDSTRDYDLTCPAYVAAPAIPYPLSSANDLNGDWWADVVARERATGALLLYPGNAKAGLLPPTQIGWGWQSMSIIDTAGDLTGDGVPDVLARERATGTLWLYPRSSSGGWLARRAIGPGWNAMNAVIGVGDFNGDRYPDVLAREAATGYLWLYPGNGAGTFKARIRVGSGWNGFNLLLGPGDVNGDGNVDVLARRSSDGGLWLYPGNGQGGWLSPVQIGWGWNVFSAIAAPGDLTGDGAPDLVARDPATGRLWIYPTDGAGHWRARIALGIGWNAMDVIT